MCNCFYSKRFKRFQVLNGLQTLYWVTDHWSEELLV